MAGSTIRRDAVVTVISGDHKGKSGKVLTVQRAKNRVIIEGVNLRKRAVRRSAEHPTGGIEEVECPIHISNVMLQEVLEARQAKRTAAKS